MISIHALREEGDASSTPIPRGAINFYPRPPRGGRRAARETVDEEEGISIHALREEGDAQAGATGCRRDHHFYPRPPRGGRLCRNAKSHSPSLFLSTPSARRATWASMLQTSRRGYFYPRPPRGGRLQDFSQIYWLCEFLSTPSARRATHHPAGYAPAAGFLSTPSARRATYTSRRHRQHRANFYPRPPRGGRPVVTGHSPLDKRISIHALREEGDGAARLLRHRGSYFYPRPPRGGRLGATIDRLHRAIFLSTPSARRATYELQTLPRWQIISIHALREEGDPAL